MSIKIYALLNGSAVYNIIETDGSGWPEGIEITDLDPRPSIGWTYAEDSGEFAPPQPDDQGTPPPGDVAPPRRLISGLAFDRRFTLQERVNIEVASQHNPNTDIDQQTQSATLRVIQERAKKAAFIDLDDPDTQSGVMYMEQLGLLSTERAIEILTTPVQLDEEP